jgi:sugar O-acyltransferase (sialic acid O-acetyltransferase NeuD family)
VILLGSGGHAKVLLSLAKAAGLEVVGVSSPQLAGGGAPIWRGVPVIGSDEALSGFDPAQVGLVNGVGMLVGSRARRLLYEKLRDKGFRFPPLKHPAASVDPSARLADGVQIMAGAVVQADAEIGENTIVNTRAGIDHDCVIGAHVHVAPGATLCGGVRLGNDVFVGTGATVIQSVTIGEGAVVSAGTTVTRDLQAQGKSGQ